MKSSKPTKPHKAPPVLMAHHRAFGFEAKNPFHWQMKILTDKKGNFQYLDYYPSTDRVVYAGKTYQMSWHELAKGIAAEQRNYMGHLK